jgi:Lsr2
MAQKVSIVFEDDLEGGPAHETMQFVVEGVEYEIDLNKKNAAAFREHFAPYIQHARKAGPGQRRRQGRTSSSRQRSENVRSWAKQRGIAVSDRGRIPASVLDQWVAAGKPPPGPPSTPPRPRRGRPQSHEQSAAR